MYNVIAKVRLFGSRPTICVEQLFNLVRFLSKCFTNATFLQICDFFLSTCFALNACFVQGHESHVVVHAVVDA